MSKVKSFFFLCMRPQIVIGYWTTSVQQTVNLKDKLLKLL